MATETEKINNPLEEKSPNKTLDLTAPQSAESDRNGDPSDIAPATVDTVKEGTPKEGEDSKASVGAAAAADSGPITDTEKKIRRAERFGMPVQLSESEKRNSRAERFGTCPVSHGPETSTKSEELKRKARAERFGLSVQTIGTEEEAKKKARLARFAPVTKADTVEEDKRKARVIRFSGTPSSTTSQVNGKGNVEPTAAIAGKAGGGA